ncbi:MAG: peptidylprolyl isomerase [Chthoniobacterales bacterium]|nr:peptidylprolyl isomerase [Chthoniobacterales bacterium]
MKRIVRIAFLIVCACAAGLLAAEVLYRTTWSRNAIGQLLGRGRLLAVVDGQAIYQNDLFTQPDGNAETMVMAEALRHGAAGRRATAQDMDREIGLLQAQFGDEATFAAALESSELTDGSLNSLVADHIEVRRYLEGLVAGESTPTEEEIRQRYDADASRWALRQRWRARHIFIAAPEGTDGEVLTTKGNAAGALSMRLLAGEADFAQLAAEASEDEATRLRGGDLGYFSASRVPVEFIAELEKLQLNQTSAPFRSHLGFHIVELTDSKPPRVIAFEEARAEIATELANEKRAARIAVEIAMMKSPNWAPFFR